MPPIDIALDVTGRISRPLIGPGRSLGEKPRILILKPCCIGDVLFATPLIRMLRLALPDAHLAFGVGSWSRPIVASNPRLDAILDTGRVGSGRWTWTELLSLTRRISACRFDACLVLERSLWLALLPALGGVPLRIGLDSGGRGLAHHRRVRVVAGRHETDLYLDVGRALLSTAHTTRPVVWHRASGRQDHALRDDATGMWRAEAAGRAPEFFPTPTEQTRAIEALAAIGVSPKRAIALHPGGGSNPGMLLARKRWPVPRTAALAERIAAEGYQPLLVGGPSDTAMEAGVQRELREPIPSVVGRLGLGEMGALLAQVAGYVGGDTGLTHLASAVGTPTVALFGPSDPAQYGPLAPNAVVIQGMVPCGPCFRDGTAPPCAHHVCMERIEPDAVWTRLVRLLDTRHPAEVS